MTLKQLTKLVDREALWNPGARASQATVRVRVVIRAIRQTCGRPECLIVPVAGSGQAWVRRETLQLDHSKPCPTTCHPA